MSEGDRLLGVMLDHLLKRGLGSSGFSEFAAAAGVSEDDLRQHYKDRDELLIALLAAAAYAIESQFLAHLPATRMPAAELYDRLGEITDSAWMKSYMRLWGEMIVATGRGVEPVGYVSREIDKGFREMIDAHLAIDDPDERREITALLLVQTDAAAMFEPFEDGEHVAFARKALSRLLRR